MSSSNILMEAKRYTNLNFPQRHELPSKEVDAALEDILRSPFFQRANRMCQLLRYLIEKKMSGLYRDMSEYAIGLEVFERNPSSYYPTLDPVVRVHVGRLRKRLQSYYAALAYQPKVIVSIPTGHYAPVIQCRAEVPSNDTNSDTNSDANGDANGNTKAMQSLAILPLYYLDEDFHGRVLTREMNEELQRRFQHALGPRLVSFADLHCGGNIPHGNPVNYFLEGSVLHNAQEVKANIRIVDARSHAIVFSQRLVQPSAACASVREKMAQHICAAVQRYWLDL